jgi:hypothetical protein
VPVITAPMDRFDLFTLNNALDRFKAEFPWRIQVVKLRYFVGLALPEVTMENH